MGNGEELDGYVTIQGAKAILGISDGRIRQILNDDERRKREFPGARKLGRVWLLPVAEVEAFKDKERKTGYPAGKPRKKRQNRGSRVFRRILTPA
jgi:hypothetical protein